MSFSFLRQIKIKTRLAISLMALTGFLITIGIVWSQTSSKIVSGLDQVSNAHFPILKASMEMEMAVVEIKQFFTDAAFTHPVETTEGANKWRKVFHKNSTLIIEATDQPDIKSKMAQISEQFGLYYKQAESLPRTYLNDGIEAGNASMGKINRLAGKLRKKISAVTADAETELTETLAQTRSLTFTSSLSDKLAFAAATLIFIFLSGFIFFSITNPLDDLIIRLRMIARGPVVDLSKDIRADQKDEISEVAELFNEFMYKIRSIVAQLAEMVTGLQSTTTQLSTKTEEYFSHTGSQRHQVEMVSTNIEEVNEAVSNISTRSAEVTKATSETKELAINSGNVIGASASAIAKLSDYSTKISNILLVIEDIAKQTDLLAINASIEAANAGEQGKGFAVVADEVRKLAERTTKATAEIGKMIHDIETYSSGAVLAMKDSSEAIDKIIRESARIYSMMEQINATAEKQSSVVKQMVSNVKKVQEVSQEFSAHAEDSNAVVSEISRNTSKLMLAIDQFKVQLTKGTSKSIVLASGKKG
jgi:methyl-accepting chemotaxis protein